MSPGSSRRTAMIGAILLAACAVPAFAQEKFPSKPVTIVVPYEAGGGGDVYSRVLQPFLEKELGTKIVIENIAGAGGIIGQTNAFKRPADGYTLVLWSTPSNELNAITNDVPFKMTDWEGLGAAAPGQTIAAVPADRPWKSVAELVKDMQARPNTITLGGIGPYGIGGIAYAKLVTEFNARGRWVPYAGTNEVATALLGGHVDVALVGGSEDRFTNLMKTDKIRILGVFAKDVVGPYATINLTTVEKQTGKLINLDVQRAHVVRASTPPDRLAFLRAAYQKAVTDPAFVDQIKSKVGPYGLVSGPELSEVLHKGSTQLQDMLPTLKTMAGN